MLEMNHVSLKLNQNNRPLVQDFSYVLLPGDKTAIIGVSNDWKYINEVCQKAYWFDECGLLSISIEDAVKGKKPKTRSK